VPGSKRNITLDACPAVSILFSRVAVKSWALAVLRSGIEMSSLRQISSDDRGQDIAEYAVMLAVILVLVVGTIRLVGSNANNAFSNVASTLQ
jgi:Flp pilus assembly pilin Flp